MPKISALPAAIIAASVSCAAAAEVEIPDIAQALLDAAYETGDTGEIEAVANAVAKVFPDYTDAISENAAAEIAALTPPDAPAEETAAPAPASGAFAVRPWDGKIQAGASYASGNSDNLAIGLALDAARASGDFTHNVTAFIDIAESENVTTQKRWGAAYQLDYNFSEDTYAYGRLAFEEDQFSGFDYRLFAGAGLGHFFYKSEPFTWKIEGGPGYRYSLIDNSPETSSEFALYAASEMDWLIRDGVKFEQDVNITWTSPTTTFQSITALTTSLTDSISTAISFEYRYETDPPLGRVKADKIAKASLVYGF